MKYWLLPVILLLLLSCGKKKADFSGETEVTMTEFMSAFPKLNLPLTVGDTNIAKVGDTLVIGYKTFLQFFPDSVLIPIVGIDKAPVIHPVGRIEKEKENYLLARFTMHKITKLAVFVTDKKNTFLASRELLSTQTNKEYTHTVTVNREPTFLLSMEKPGKDNTVLFSRTGWVYSMGHFGIVINDSNEDPKKMNVINPIDTLPRKNKFSGEYVRDKKNFISVRDGNRPGMYYFFIHFTKNDGSCTGELKGEMKMKDATAAQYTGNGDPCIIDFTFEGNQITLKEQGSCGNHRGIKCFFDDTFTKKKESRSSRKK